MKLKLTLLFLTIFSFNSYSQNFRNETNSNDSETFGVRTYFLKGANLKNAEELIIDGLLDNDWDINASSFRAHKIFYCKTALTSGTMGVPVPVSANFIYTFEEKKDGVLMKINFNLDHKMCVMDKSLKLDVEFFDKFWESASVGKYYKNIKIESVQKN